MSKFVKIGKQLCSKIGKRTHSKIIVVTLPDTLSEKYVEKLRSENPHAKIITYTPDPYAELYDLPEDRNE